ncbi:ABC transporter permease [candidate division KSB1 bacterium]|nr:ABC transporter permease [candidate division KSB1 bacterium]
MNRLKPLFLLLSKYTNKKRRLFYNVLLLSLGIAAIVLLLTASEMVRTEILRRFHSEGIDLFTIIKKADAGRIASGQGRYLNPQIIEWLKEKNSPVLEAAPEKRINLPVRFHDQNFSAPIIGTTSSFQQVHDLKLRGGRFLSTIDKGQQHCVIGFEVFQKLRRMVNGDLVGKIIHIGPLTFQITGILRKSRGFQSEYSIDESVLIPLSTLLQFSNSLEISKIIIKAAPQYPISHVDDNIRNKLTLFLGDARNYEVTNQQIFIQRITEQSKQISTYTGLIGCLLLVLWFHLFIRLLGQSVDENKPLLSFYRILGVSESRLYWLIFFEVLVPGLLAWMIGVAIGYGLSLALAREMGWLIRFPLHILLSSFGITVLLIGLTSYFPAIEAGHTRLSMQLKLE